MNPSLSALALCLPLAALASPPIIPRPVALETRPGNFVLTRNSRVIVAGTARELSSTAQYLAAHLAPGLGVQPESLLARGSRGIRLSVLKAPEPGLGDEGYRLTVSAKGIELAANRPAGCFYAAQTLLQLLPPQVESRAPSTNSLWQVPCLVIEDHPRFHWRGLLLDVSRHYFTPAEVMAYIDQMARYKLNVLQLHLTDDQGWRLAIAGEPKLTDIGAWRVPRVGQWWQLEPPQPGEAATDGGFYRREDIQAMVAHARDRFVTIVPEVDVPGHSMALLAAHPEISCLGGAFQVNPGSKFYGQIENAVCPGKEQTYAVLERVFGEVAARFPGEYVHMGGDEAFKGFWSRCPDCQARMKKEGLKNVEELQSYFVKRIEKMLNAKGKRLIGWDEILEGGLAPNATVMSWRGVGGGIAAAKAGHDVVMTPSPYYYLDLYQGDPLVEPNTYSLARLKTTYGFEPLAPGMDPRRLLGVQGNVWSESIPTLRHAQYMTWPRGFAIAETGWSAGSAKDWNDFAGRVEHHFQRFAAADWNCARSVYDPIISARRNAEGGLEITLETELEGLDIHYTFAGPEPDAHYPRYEKPLRVPKNAADLRVVTCRNGVSVGRQIRVPIAELEQRAKK